MKILLPLGTLLAFLILNSSAISVWKDLTLTHEEKQALDKFKKVVNDILPHDYMRKDIYLIKWLRARNLDIQGAEKMLKQHLKWRKENRLDTIVDEDFGSLMYEFPYSTDGTDYEGRPVLAMNAGEWNIRSVLLSGRKEEVTRWAFRAYEVGRTRVRQLQEEGKNVTQFVLVCNFGGFNLVEHVCPSCVQFIVNFLASYEQNYPGMADSIIAIKTPQTFMILFRALTTVMSKETREAVKIWGTSPQEWKTNLLKQIPPDQLDEEFGGTRNQKSR